MTVSELDSDVNFLCGSTSATYPVADKRRNMNIAYNDVARIIWEADGGWNYDDANASTLPEATTTLVHNQQDYTIPSTTHRIDRIEVKNANGDFMKLQPLDMADTNAGMSEVLGGNAGMPLYYVMEGRSILLYPTPHSAHVTVTNGLKIYVDRDVTELAVTATTTEPGFAKPFHRILSYAAAMDFTQDERQRQFLAVQKDRLEQGMVAFYSKRGSEIKTRVKPGARKYWRNYE